MLTPVDELPPSGGRQSEPFAAKYVREFLRKRMHVASLEIEGKTPDAIKKSASSYIRKKGIKGIEAVRRGSKCYLNKTTPYEGEGGRS